MKIKKEEIKWFGFGIAAMITSLASQVFWDAHGAAPALICLLIALTFINVMRKELGVCFECHL